MFSELFNLIATVFIDASAFTPTTARITKIGEILGDDFVPTFEIEVSVAGSQQRIAFRTNSGELTLSIYSVSVK